MKSQESFRLQEIVIVFHWLGYLIKLKSELVIGSMLLRKLTILLMTFCFVYFSRHNTITTVWHTFLAYYSYTIVTGPPLSLYLMNQLDQTIATCHYTSCNISQCRMESKLTYSGQNLLTKFITSSQASYLLQYQLLQAGVNVRTNYS